MSLNSLESSSRINVGRIVLYLILGVIAVYYLIPLFIMVTTSLKTMQEIRDGSLLGLPQGLNFDAWTEAWGTACIGVQCDGLKSYFWNSVKMVVPAVLISTIMGAFAGYTLTKWRFKGSEIIFSLLLVGCFIPFQVVILPMARTLGILGIGNSNTGLILVHVVYGLSFTTLFFRNFYVTIPTELIKAAKMDGAGYFRIFWKIIMPLSVPIFVVSIIWETTNIWNDFLFGVVFSSGDAQPMTVALNNLVNTTTSVKRYNVDMAAAIIAGIPTIVVYVVSGKYFIRGLTAGSVKG